MPQPPRITVLGSLNMDISVTVPRLAGPGETVLGSAARLQPGGKGANQAVAAARLGASVRMAGCCGDDAFGRELRSALEAAGVDITAVRVLAGVPSGLALITVDATGENSITVAPGANGLAGPPEAAASAASAAGASARGASGARRVGRGALRRADPVRGDPGSGPGGRPRPGAGRAGDDGAEPRAGPAGRLRAPRGGGGLADRQRPGSGRDPGPARDRPGRGPGRRGRPGPGGCGPCRDHLGSGGARRRGRILAGSGAVLAVPGFSVRSVDSVGAGDAFVAALGVAVASGAAPPEAVRLACAVGATAVTRPGAQDGLPAGSDVLAATGVRWPLG